MKDNKGKNKGEQNSNPQNRDWNQQNEGKKPHDLFHESTDKKRKTG